MTVAEQLRQEGRDEMERKVAEAEKREAEAEKREAEAEKREAEAERREAEAEKNCIRALLNTGFNQQKIAETLGLPLARVQTLVGES